MDAFISYRRNTGGLYADEINTFLTKKCKMDVFYDRTAFYEHAGEFPKVLEESIAQADNFILILTDFNIEGNLEDSFFVQEIMCAFKLEKRIIVLRGNNFRYPDHLPTAIEKLPELQDLDISDVTYFKGAFFVDLLAKMYPSEKRNKAYDQLVSISKLESRDSIESRLSLTDRLSNDVKSVHICALACGGFISSREYLDLLIKNNCKVEIIINRPGSPAAEDACIKKIGGGLLSQRRRILKRSYEDLKDWQSEYPDIIEGRTPDEFLPFALFIIRTKNPKKDTIKVDYYSFDDTDTQRRSVMISYTDRENFDFYLKQFEWLWNNSNPLVFEEEEV